MTSRPPSPRDLLPALLERYETSAPRYTSYPTAPHFRQDVDRGLLAEAWRRTGGPGAAGLSLYVHVPFCRSRCAYCGCYTLTDQPDTTLDAYQDALLLQAGEAAALLDASRPVRQLSFGGGTPTFPGPARFRRLVEGLRAIFSFPPEGERAVEVDPRAVDTEYLDLLVDLGFNRFSFGVQDLDPGVQAMVNRILPADRLEALLAHLRGRGVDAINLDLIYGLPGQTEERFATTLRRVISLAPTRLAVFGYAHVPWVAPHQEALSRFPMPDRSQRHALFSLAWELLVDAGWVQVGMDHFARPEDELTRAFAAGTLHRNFMGYTTMRGLDLAGLGASAISAVGGTYVQTVKALPAYLAARGLERWDRGWILDREDHLRRDVIIDLFCNLRLDLPRVEGAHGIDFREHFAAELADLAPLAADGLVELRDREIRVTPTGRFFVRNVALVFDRHLRTGVAPGARYSRTI